MPGELVREMQADDHRVLVLRSTASEAVTRGKTRAWVELAYVKGQRLTRPRCRTPVGNIMCKLRMVQHWPCLTWRPANRPGADRSGALSVLD